ncbi:hypothetical protein FJY71_01330 [candidate division WOR-3 bacterium]|nr:hypothetical protein [candidate division WOR-3 bacterium]
MPTDSRVYDDFDLLKTSGLVRAMPYTSRPWTRQFCLRLLVEAESLAALCRPGPAQRAALARLGYEFGEELGRERARRPLLSVPVPDMPGATGRGELFCRGGAARRRQHDSAAATGAMRDRQAFSFGAVLGNRPNDGFAFYERAEVELFRPIQRDVWDSSGFHLPGSRAADFHGMLKFEIEHAYLALKVPWVRLEAGRDRMSWGPGHLSSAMLSDHAPSLDHVQVSASYANFRFVGFTSLLSDWDMTRHRFLSAQRVEASLWQRLTLGAAMMNVYSWDSLILTPIGGFLNPLLPGYIEAANSHHTSNLLVGFDAAVYLPRTRVYGQLMFDNYEFNTRRDAPNCVGTQVGAYWAPQLPVEARVEYASVTAFTYFHRLHYIMYENYGVPLGHEIGPDADRWWGRVRFTPLAALQVGVWADYTRRGFYNRGDFRRKSFWYETESLHAALPAEFPSPGRDSTGAVIEEVDLTWRFGPELEWWPAERLRLVADAAYLQCRNFNGEIGVDRSGFEFGIRAEYRY